MQRAALKLSGVVFGPPVFGGFLEVYIMDVSVCLPWRSLRRHVCRDSLEDHRILFAALIFFGFGV